MQFGENVEDQTTPQWVETGILLLFLKSVIIWEQFKQWRKNSLVFSIIETLIMNIVDWVNLCPYISTVACPTYLVPITLSLTAPQPGSSNYPNIPTRPI